METENLLTELANTTSAQDAYNFLFEHPVLLTPSKWPELSEKIEKYPADRQQRTKQVLNIIEKTYSDLSSDISAYPFGTGPVEHIWTQVDNGEITLDAAKKAARKTEVYELLSPLYVNFLSIKAEKTAQHGDWRSATSLQQILIEAVETYLKKHKDNDGYTMFTDVSLRWLDIVARATSDIPDGRLFHHAIKLANKLKKHLSSISDNDILAELYHRLGVLHLDPYIYGRSSSGYEQQYSQWQKRLDNELGDSIAFIDEKEIRLPRPEQAFKKAINFFNLAAELRQTANQRRGKTLKALAEAQTWYQITGGKVDVTKLLEIAKEAYLLLDQEENEQLRATLTSLIAYHSSDDSHDDLSDDASLDELLNVPLDSLLNNTSPAELIILYTQNASKYRKKDPALALSLLMKIRPIIDNYATEAEKIRHYTTEYNLLADAIAPMDNISDDEYESLKNNIDAVVDQAIKDDLSQEQLGAFFLHAAFHAIKNDQEHIALSFIQQIQEYCPTLVEQHHKAFYMLVGNTYVGVAVNAVNNQDNGPAVDAYWSALRLFVLLEMHDISIDILQRIISLVDTLDEEGLISVVSGLAKHALRLEINIGDTAINNIQKCCSKIMQNIAANGRINPNLLLILWQIAKGLSFSTALENSSIYDWKQDQDGIFTLDRIQTLENELDLQRNDNTKIILLDENELLGAYSSDELRYEGDNPAQVIANLQQIYNSHLKKVITSNTGDFEFKSLDDIQSALDDNTVLINYYLGSNNDGLVSLYIMLVSNDEIHVSSGVIKDLPTANISIGDGSRQVDVSWFTLPIGSLRSDIISDPGNAEVVTSEAAKKLSLDRENYFGGDINKKLQQMHKQGKNHICFIPHAAMHYYPFHLVGTPDHLLSQEWIVSYLPNIALLSRQVSTPSTGDSRQIPLSVFGVDFQDYNPLNLPELYNVADEIETIAMTYGVQPKLNKQAGKSAVIDAFLNSKRIHLSTHGRHNVASPAFQCIYLYPENDTDGIIFSYEILGYDLTGLDLVTLSACETALGRFDKADNLWGLPASLLLAGVSSIIGTLWEVEANAAEFFFTSLYSELNMGSSKLDAFAHAQRETRQEYPQYRDWGAFYFIGNW